MKCPNCGFNSFDYLEECKKCKLPLNPSSEYKSLYKRTRKSDTAKSVDVNETKAAPRDIPDASDTKGKVYEDSASYEMAAASLQEHNVPVYKKTKVTEPENEELISETAKTTEQCVPEPDEAIDSLTNDPELYSESLNPEDATNESEIGHGAEDTDSYSIAALKTRAAAFIVDLFVVGLISYIAIEAGFYIMGGGEVPILEVQRIFLPIYILLFFLASTYFVFLHYYAGTTVGKMIFGIRIISSDGGDIGLWESFMRWVGYYISAAFLFAGFIWSIFDRDSQAWHDKIAGTYVVKG